MKENLTLQIGVTLIIVGLGFLLFYGNLLPIGRVSQEEVNSELISQISDNLNSLRVNLQVISNEGAEKNALDQVALITRKIELLRVPLGVRFTIWDILGIFILSSGITSASLAVIQLHSE